MIVSMQYAVVRVRELEHADWPDWGVVDTDTGDLRLFGNEQEARDACDEWNRTGGHS